MTLYDVEIILDGSYLFVIVIRSLGVDEDFELQFFLGVIGFTVGTDDDDETSMQTMNTFTKALTSLL